MSFSPTEEQDAIIAAGRDGGNLVITAGAGTGKTTTLKLMAEKMSGSGLYLAYNKAIQVEAAAKFPRHVQCKTAHSVAYGAVGKRYRARMAAPFQNSREVASILGINEPLKLGKDLMLRPAALARLAMETVSTFCSSADQQIQPWHVPRQTGVDDDAAMREVRKIVLPAAADAWENLQADDERGRFDADEPESYRGWIRFKHDHYLKMWALREPRLNADFVLFDEAQDANPVIADVVQNQQNAQLIAVGDSSQQLYAWRGAVDALAQWPADQRLQLSESFRFGAGVAEEANKWLDLLGAELRITGSGPDSLVAPIQGWPDAVLCRTNAACMDQAMRALGENLRVAISGGAEPIRNLATAALALQSGKSTAHPELCVFNSWREVQEYAENEPDAGDLKTQVRLVDKHGASTLLDAVKQLVPDKKTRTNGRWIKPDVLISTAHKSKGLEWDSVRIEDFSEPVDAEGKQRPVSKAMAMLAYVSVTRAQKQLDRASLSWIDGRAGQRAV